MLEALDNFCLRLEGKTDKEPKKTLNGIKEVPLSNCAPIRKTVAKKKNNDKMEIALTGVDFTAKPTIPKTDNNNPFLGFVGFNQAKKPQTFKLKGDLGEFVGEYDHNCFSIVLRGDKGAGKSRLLYQFINAFAEKGYTVGFLSLEMASGGKVSVDYRDEYIKPANLSKIDVSDFAPNYEQLNKICKKYDVVAIDSWTKLKGLEQEDFDRLQKENPQTIIISIFQSTTGKVTRGGNMPEFDGGIVIHVHKGGIAECEKNRYAPTDLKYSVFNQRLIQQEVELQ